MKRAEAGVLGWIDRDITEPMRELPGSEPGVAAAVLGALRDVPARARRRRRRDDGRGVPEHDHAAPPPSSRPGLMVMGIIMFMGKVSGAHLNPAVSIAFSLRGDFPWRRVPGYIVVQLIGASLAALFLHEVIKVSAKFGSNYVASRLLGLAGLPDGGGAHARARQRHPRHRLGRAEHRHLRRDRRRRLHRARRALGQPDLRAPR